MYTVLQVNRISCFHDFCYRNTWYRDIEDTESTENTEDTGYKGIEDTESTENIEDIYARTYKKCFEWFRI